MATWLLLKGMPEVRWEGQDSVEAIRTSTCYREAEEMAQSVKCLSQKHEDLNSTLRIHKNINSEHKKKKGGGAGETEASADLEFAGQNW